MSGSRRVRALSIAALAVFLSSGCKPPAPAASQPAAVESVAERGPLRFVVSASPANVLVGDAVRIELRMRSPAEYRALLPQRDAFDPNWPLTAVAGPSVAVASDGTRTIQQVYSLDVLGSEPIEIPALTARYGEDSSTSAPTSAPATDAELEGELSSQPLTIAVKSVLTENDAPEQPREITGVVRPPPRKWTALDWAIALVTTAIALLGAHLLFRRFRARWLRPPPPIAPEIWALRELERLAALPLDGFDRVRNYYYRVSEIVREYIEKKFALRAPEMTTEEFIRSAATADAGRGRAARLPFDPTALRPFLEACDRVKYAAYEPMPEDAQETLETARAFIHHTAAAADMARAAS